jgi:L-ascorbate metabolism protein UlaG (beta-lactamase superfamily)
MLLVKRLLAMLAALVLVAALAVVVVLNVRPDAGEFAALRLGSDPAASAPGGLWVTFLGVSTLLFDDGETAIMTDGFFSRPGLLSVATRIAPDVDRISEALRRARVRSLAAVIPVHSHYDHAMDAPYVAQSTGAVLVGSPSTANVGRGAGLPEDRIKVAADGEPMVFGRFRVTLLPSDHVPSPVLMPGEIASPLTPPARTRDYRLGKCYSVVIEHDGRTILVQGSAGFLPGALNGVRADVVYLGVATLGTQGSDYRESFWREVVQRVDARRVVAIHWDDFLRPLSEPLVPLPRVLDDFAGTMRFLAERGARDGVDVRLPVEFAAVDPFAGLERRP